MNCKKCEDRKYVMYAGKWKPCECLIEKKILIKYHRSRIPPFFHRYTWQDYLHYYPAMKSSVKLCKQIIKAIKEKVKVKFLYIQGESNTGKLALISMLLKEFINNGFSCKLLDLSELINMEFDKDEKEELRKVYEEYDVVSLRIGTVIEHSYARPVLEKFYNKRKNNNKYAIFSSRLNVENSQSLYGIEFARLMNDGRRIKKIETKRISE